METAEILVRYVEDDAEFELVYAIRAEVFQRERGLDEAAEIDGHEHIAHHYLASVEGRAVGTARWRMTMAGKAKLERFAVLADARGMGVGSALVKAVLRHVPPGRVVYLEALADAVPFFARHGFVAEGEVFEVEGLQHRKMVLVR